MFVEDFCICVPKRYWPVLYFLGDVFGFDIRIKLAVENELECVKVRMAILFSEEFVNDL